MNKRDKEVIAYQLDDEKKVLRELKRQYERSLLTIESKIKLLQSGEMTQSKIYQINYQKALKAQVDAILDKLQSDEYDTIQQYLERSYTDGYVGAMYQIGGSGVNVIVPIDQDAAAKAIITDSKLSVNLYASLGYDMDKIKKSVRDEITRGISASLSYEEIARNLTEYSTVALSNANRIVRTEAHRIQQASADDARLAAKAKGADVVKQWDCTMDGATRPMHRELDGQIREVNEPFEAGGKKVMYPGKFGTPDQDCNCRCVALTRARWALDEEELETLKKRAEYFGLDKKDSFVEYKKKYLKASELLKNQGKSDIIKEKGNLSIPVSKFTGYALNPDRDIDKATAFKKALGYDMTNADDLIQNILDHVDESQFVPKTDNGYGMLYEYIMQLIGPNGKKANVLTAWIEDGKKKRMTSVYVTEKKVTEHED